MKILSVPQPTITVEFDTALRTLVAQAATRYPGEQARIDRGLVLALNSHVTLHTDGTATVQSGTDTEMMYHVGQGTCDCPDFSRAPEGRCKHRFAVALVKKARAACTYTRVAYHAHYGDAYGMAIRDEQGHIWFHAEDDSMTRLYETDMAQLFLHGRVDISATQRVNDARRELFQACASQNTYKGRQE